MILAPLLSLNRTYPSTNLRFFRNSFPSPRGALQSSFRDGKLGAVAPDEMCLMHGDDLIWARLLGRYPVSADQLLRAQVCKPVQPLTSLDLY
jgi:hypothetical protein